MDGGTCRGAGGNTAGGMDGTVFNLERYAGVWARVAPGLEPYPADSAGTEDITVTADGAGIVDGAAGSPGEMDGTASVGAVSADSAAPYPTDSTAPYPKDSAAPYSPEETAAVLAGFIEDALVQRRQILGLAGQAPTWARRPLRDMAAASALHARRLQAAHYLSTGERYAPSVSQDRVYPGRWGPAVRERYQAKVWSGVRYGEAVERTEDPCLAGLLEEIGAEEYRHAGELLRLMERSLGTQ